MATSEAKRRANNKWNKENRVVFSCSTNKAEAAAFKVYAEREGKTPNALLKGYIMSCIDLSQPENSLADN